MKRIIFVCLMGLFVVVSKADTIDFWHVYFNGVKIKECVEYERGRCEIHLKRSKIKETDTITLKYFRDTPCDDCTTYLKVENGKHATIVSKTGKGTFNPVSFTMKEVISYNYFEVWYYEDGWYQGKKLLVKVFVE